jgi:hypothetical protein
MKIIIFDPYKTGNYKTNKDQAGGYGTCNKLGSGVFSNILSFFVKKMINYPPLYSLYIFSILKKKGFEVVYTQNYNDVKNCDLCLITSSIVCHETEVNFINQLKKKNIYTGVIGSFCTVLPDLYLTEADFVVSGEPEFFFLNENIKEIIISKKRGILKTNISNNLDELPYPAFEEFLK